MGAMSKVDATDGGGMTNKTKNAMQITWKDIKITARPPVKKCGKNKNPG